MSRLLVVTVMVAVLTAGCALPVDSPGETAARPSGDRMVWNETIDGYGVCTFYWTGDNRAGITLIGCKEAMPPVE